jgi:hypothetical protein
MRKVRVGNLFRPKAINLFVYIRLTGEVFFGRTFESFVSLRYVRVVRGGTCPPLLPYLHSIRILSSQTARFQFQQTPLS